MENFSETDDNKKLISLETPAGCKELLRSAVILLREVHEILDALGDRKNNIEAEGYDF
ncbi:hypothetical protein GW879_01295, partial [Candidatus Kaiserbacteria bacterium]|nr:hypothetical protein [Candidatus Kaiserbacteria bacterium]